MTAFDKAVAASAAYLASDAAKESLARDPYWPKWDSPWWHMTVLWELGLAERIPPRAVRAMIRAFRTHFLTYLPMSEADIPPGKDYRRHFPCHCGLGTMVQVLTACGMDVDRELPWVRPWFLMYQLPDGGLNCDEKAYSKKEPKSSIVSTLPALEAVLLCTPRPFTPKEAAFLDRGAEYLLAHRLYRSTSGKAIDEAWLQPCFPRFYHYDVLRGLKFLAAWARARRKPYPRYGPAEVNGLLLKRYPDGRIVPERFPWREEKTLIRDAAGTWAGVPKASEFELLVQAAEPENAAPILSAEWVGRL